MNVTKPTPLPLKEFLDSFRNVPRLAINLLILNSKQEFLLTKRSIPPFPGSWHLPGGFLLKNERIADCLKRIAQKELGLKLKTQIQPILLGAFDNLSGDPRGHIVDLVYKINNVDESSLVTTKETSSFKFFAEPPLTIGFNQSQIFTLLSAQGPLPVLE